MLIPYILWVKCPSKLYLFFVTKMYVGGEEVKTETNFFSSSETGKTSSCIWEIMQRKRCNIFTKECKCKDFKV